MVIVPPHVRHQARISEGIRGTSLPSPHGVAFRGLPGGRGVNGRACRVAVVAVHFALPKRGLHCTLHWMVARSASDSGRFTRRRQFAGRSMGSRPSAHTQHALAQ